jgi:phage terminase large subunit-like protein
MNEQQPIITWRLRCVRSWDLAFTTKTSSDFTVGAKVGITQDGLLVVVHVVRGRWEWASPREKSGSRSCLKS